MSPFRTDTNHQTVSFFTIFISHLYYFFVFPINFSAFFQCLNAPSFVISKCLFIYIGLHISLFSVFRDELNLNLICGRECLDANSQIGQMSLICAASKGHADFVRLLLEAGADKEVKDNVRVCFSTANLPYICPIFVSIC